MKKIIFVCTGNTCRSPMAEAIFRELAGDAFSAGSAGIFASEGCPAAGEAVNALREYGLDLSAHLSRALTPEMIEEGDIFVPMTKSHEASLAAAGVPPEKIHTIGHVEDPFGGGAEVYRRCAELLRERLLELYGRLRDD